MCLRPSQKLKIKNKAPVSEISVLTRDGLQVGKKIKVEFVVSDGGTKQLQ